VLRGVEFKFMVWRKNLDINRSVGVIFKENKIFLLHRFKDGHEYWVFPGGKVEDGEINEDALDRELKEELCIEVKKKSFLFEISNLGRKEYHFLIEDFTGEMQLGEKDAEELNRNDQCIFTWIPLEIFEKIPNFYPEESRKLVLSKLS
jgi:mutator protein MutT